MKVTWTRHARAELTAIHDYIAASSPKYALAMVDRITRKSQGLAQYPRMGSVVVEYGDPDVRELIEYPYRIIYRLRSNRIDVLSVIHGARELPRQAPGST